MASHSEWQNRSITSLRFDPTGTSGATFSIDWVRSSNGDLDGDTLGDMAEGDGDYDQDGLVNLEDPDSDGDNTPDGLDPQPYFNPFDTDQDGIPDILDPDDDNDGAPDANDAFPWILQNNWTATAMALAITRMHFPSIRRSSSTPTVMALETTRTAMTTVTV